jgi:hypothetical protein
VELLEVLAQIGFSAVRLTERFDPFRSSSKERTARKYGVSGVNVHAAKP